MRLVRVRLVLVSTTSWLNIARKDTTTGYMRQESIRNSTLAASHGSHDSEGLCSHLYRIWQGSIWRFERQVFSAGEEADEGPPLLCDVVADRSTQHRIFRLKRIKNRTLSCQPFDLKLHLFVDLCKCAQVVWKHNADHGRVWTSTDSTAGRLLTMGIQLSPESEDAYTCPPVVPK